MDDTIAVKIKCKTFSKLVTNLSKYKTVREFKEFLSDITKIPIHSLNVLSGFPPVRLDLSRDDSRIGRIGVVNGTTLIVDQITLRNETETSSSSSVEPMECEPSTSTGITHPRPSLAQHKHQLLRYVVPADNSCLFSSVNYVLNGKLDERGPFLRSVVADIIRGDPETYSEAILGKPPEEYCQWIQDVRNWGGAIELAALSQYYSLELAVVDTTNAIINRFGEDKNYSLRALLLFDGVHYDPIYANSVNGTEIRTMFDSSDMEVLRQAQQMAIKANSNKQFTKVNSIVVKCLNCGINLEGSNAATEHATKTGHLNFKEISHM